MRQLQRGDKIYVDSAFYISRGSADVVGGLANVTNVREGISGGKPCQMVEVAEHPGVSYNWEFLEKKQVELQIKFGENAAYPDPDIDTPWIQSGDFVDGKVYNGPDIW